MASNIQAPAGGASPSAAFASQIDKLKSDPNATPAYKQQLDQWMQALGKAAGGPAPAAGAPAASGPVPSSKPPSAPAPAPATSPAPAASKPDMPSGSAPGQVPKELWSLAPDIKAAASKSGLSQSEISAVIWDESRGKTGAASTNGGNGQTDAGLMQINPSTFGELQSKHSDLQGKSLGDASTNILAGSYLLADFKQQFGRMDLAERAYNSGAGSVDRSNANVTTTGLGDPAYIQKVGHIRDLVETGQALPP